MKYKNIKSAIHNFGDSFLSLMNYVDSDYIIDELNKINKKGYDISINWKTKEFAPNAMISPRIVKSINYWHNNINGHFDSQKVDFDSLMEFKLVWNFGDQPKVIAIDDRGKRYEKYVKNKV